MPSSTKDHNLAKDDGFQQVNRKNSSAGMKTSCPGLSNGIMLTGTFRQQLSPRGAAYFPTETPVTTRIGKSKRMPVLMMYAEPYYLISESTFH
jgi:hypothetical protein